MYNYTKNTIKLDCGSYNEQLDYKSSPPLFRMDDKQLDYKQSSPLFKIDNEYGDSIKFFNISNIDDHNQINYIEKNINKFVKDNNCKIINLKKINRYLILIYSKK